MDPDNPAVKPELVHFQAWAVLIRVPITGDMAWQEPSVMHAKREDAVAEIRRHAYDYAESGFDYYVVACEIDAELVHFAKRWDK